jgi:site-specific DNA recombinase
MTKTAAIYARISKTDPGVPKVENQIEQCRALATRLGVEVVEVYTDDGISAAKLLNRPGWNDLLRDTTAGNFEIILAVAEDRFTRQPLEKEELMLTCSEAGVTWNTVRDGEVDPALASGQFLAGLRGLLAKHEGGIRNERLIASYAAKIAKGLPIVTKRPFGYEKEGIQPRESEASELRWAYDHLIRGGSLWSIMQAWEQRGVKPVLSPTEIKRAAEENRPPKQPEWSYGSLGSLLKRPRNAGLLVHRGAVVGLGSFEAIVPVETFVLAQKILARNSQKGTQSRKPKWLLSGIATCASCGAFMRSATANGKPIYRCDSKTRVHNDGLSHSQITASVLDEEALKAITHIFFTQPRSTETHESEQIIEVQKQLAQVTVDRSKIADLALMEGMAGEARRRNATLNGREADLNEKLMMFAKREAEELMKSDAKAQFWANTVLAKKIDWEDAARAHQATREQFQSLELAQQRALVKSMLMVSVAPVSVHPRVCVEWVGYDENTYPEP